MTARNDPPSAEARRVRALVTGVGGFVGGHLAEFLARNGAAVAGIRHNRAPEVSSEIEIHSGDVTDDSFLRTVLAETAPTHVFHLAGVTAGASGGAWNQYAVNAGGTLKLLEAIEAVAISPRILISGSSAVYGAADRLPVDETAPYRPMSAYAGSKCAQELVALEGFFEKGLQIVLVRAFNLVGPRQPVAQVTSSLAWQIAQVEKGAARAVRVGNLEPRRDYVDVRDAARAYAMLAETGTAGEAYNVCSGRSHSIREILALLTGMTEAKFTVEQEPSRVRKSELEDQFGNAHRLQSKTGWKPEITLLQSLRDLLHYWKARAES